MSKSDVKVQINSLEALNRLVGDSPELEIEVRRSVLEAFARGALNNVVNAEEVAKQLKQMDDEVMKQVDEIASKALEVQGITTRQSRGRMSTKVVIPDDQKSAIRDAVEDTAYDLILETIEEIDYPGLTKEAIKRAINNYVTSQVRAFVKSGLQEAINAAIASVMEEK